MVKNNGQTKVQSLPMDPDPHTLLPKATGYETLRELPPFPTPTPHPPAAVQPPFGSGGAFILPKRTLMHIRSLMHICSPHRRSALSTSNGPRGHEMAASHLHPGHDQGSPPPTSRVSFPMGRTRRPFRSMRRACRPLGRTLSGAHAASLGPHGRRGVLLPLRSNIVCHQPPRQATELNRT